MSTLTNKERPRPLHGIFTAVPPKYDLLNRLLTFRLDEIWRKKAAEVILEEKPSEMLDLCTGTGDLALRLASKSDGSMKVTGLDFSETMLKEAEKKMLKSRGATVEFILGDAASMPFPDGHFDAVGISFAFRNLTFKNPDTPKFLAEILRVMKKGGRFVIVESSQPPNPLIRKMVHLYMKHVVATLGTWISGNKAAYRYFAWSVTQYPGPEGIKDLLLTAGFREVSYIPMTFGAAAVHVAVK